MTLLESIVILIDFMVFVLLNTLRYYYSMKLYGLGSDMKLSCIDGIIGPNEQFVCTATSYSETGLYHFNLYCIKSFDQTTRESIFIGEIVNRNPTGKQNKERKY